MKKNTNQKNTYREYDYGFDHLSRNESYARRKRPVKKRLSVQEIVAMKNDPAALSKAMSNSVFDDGEYQNLSFRNLTIKRSGFVFADLSGCDFSSTTFIECDFTFANLTGCNFSHAVLKECVFRHVTLIDADFTDTEIIFCDFMGAEV